MAHTEKCREILILALLCHDASDEIEILTDHNEQEHTRKRLSIYPPHERAFHASDSPLANHIIPANGTFYRDSRLSFDVVVPSTIAKLFAFQHHRQGVESWRLRPP
jgi:hypothetical protein